MFRAKFLGLPHVFMLGSLVLALTCGRRRCPRMLSRVGGLLKDLETLPQPAASRLLRPGVIGAAMWAIVGGITVCFVTTKVRSGLQVCGVVPSSFNTTGISCTEWLALTVGVGFFDVSFTLIAMKFIFAGLLLAHGLQLVNARLEALADAADTADDNVTDVTVAVNCERSAQEAELRRLGLLLRRLSDTMGQLSATMSAELVAVTAVCVLAQVMLAILLASTILNVGWLLRHLPQPVISLGGSCETCQVLLGGLDAAGDLLLRLQWHGPRLEPVAGRLLSSVERAQRSVGDVGLFRLRRATLLSVWSTIITYIIVMAQFRMSEVS